MCESKFLKHNIILFSTCKYSKKERKRERQKKELYNLDRFEPLTFILYRNRLRTVAAFYYTNKSLHLWAWYPTMNEYLRIHFSDCLRTCCFTYFIMYWTETIAPPCQVTSRGLYYSHSGIHVASRYMVKKKKTIKLTVLIYLNNTTWKL